MERGPLYEVQADAGALFLEHDGWELPDVFQSALDEYVALKDRVGLVDLTGWGVIRLRGSSRLDFVHRLSTNDVQRLQAGQGAPTVFTTPIGRIVDLAYALVCEEDLWLVVGRGADNVVADWLKRHIFFNDDVIVDTVTEQHGLMGICGPGAATLMAELIGYPVVDLLPFHGHTGQIAGVNVTALRSVPLGNDYLLMTQVADAPALWTALAGRVESVGGVLVGEAALESARIHAGRPRYDRELNQDFIPLEAGIRWAISFNKGCYVGQEIIARMDTRERLAKRLVVLSLRQREGIGGPVLTAGSEVRSGDTRVGQVTSVAPLADDGVVKALAYVKTGMAEPGKELSVRVGDSDHAATVSRIAGDDQ